MEHVVRQHRSETGLLVSEDEVDPLMQVLKDRNRECEVRRIQ